MTATYEKIATTTLSSASATVTFSTISGSYTDLILVSNAIGTADLNFLLRFNGDSGSNYSSTILKGNGSTASSTRFSNQTSFRGNSSGYVTTTLQSNTITQIMNYSNTTTYKLILQRFNNASVGVDAAVGLWRNTAAITSITILQDTGTTYATGCTFTLYGIKAE
jgi:hypothetical protein